MEQFSRSFMRCWVWKTYPPNGCRDCHNGCRDWQQVTCSKACLDLWKRNPSEFLHWVVTVDEFCIHHYNPDTKRESNNGLRLENLPQAGKISQIGRKSDFPADLTVFWDSKGIILMGFFKKGKTTTGLNFWQDLMKQCSSNAPILQRKNCCSTMTMPRLTPQQLSRLNSTILVRNCCYNHPTQLTWLPMIIFCSLTWKFGSAESGSPQRMTWAPQKNAILRNLMAAAIWKG